MSKVDITLSKDQTEGTRAIVSQWLYKVGDFVEKNQPIVELETDKVMMEVIAPESGSLTSINLSEGEEVADNTILGTINSEINNSTRTNNDELANSSKSDKNDRNNESELDNKPNTKQKIVENYSINNNYSPAVRRLSQQHDLNLNLIAGTGKDNRVTSRDIQNFLLNPSSKSQPLSEHIPISSMRQSIADHMVHSLLHTAPHVTSIFNLDLSAIIAHRKANKSSFNLKHVNLTFTAYFIAASVYALKKQPIINSQLHEKTIEIFKSMNIGIGTALDDGGLIVPVLKNCEHKDLFTIAHDLTQLTQQARNNKLKPSDVKGGTFTISNHGVSGSLIATPIIINQPQSAILGVGKMEKRVVVKQIDGDDVMLIKPMCYVSLTIDHRLLDAQQTNQFLADFVHHLENWQ